MISPRLIASLLLVAGLSMVAGWVTAFRNRSYLGLLGLALLGISGSLLCASKAKEMKEMGLAAPRLVTGTYALLGVAVVLGLCALAAAVQETRRRLRELQESHRAAEEALLEILKASAARQGPAAQDQPAEEAEAEGRDEQQ